MSNQARPKDAAVCADCGHVLEEDMPHICQGAAKKSAFDSTIGPGDHPTIPGEVSSADIHDPAQELIGKIIGERYEIQRLLGQGGMGVVYQARHISLEKLLAVKLLLIAQNEEYQRRFLQEAQLASQINHPNTVFLSDFGVLPDGRSYIVMELLRGPTLASVIAEGAMEPMRVCKIAAQIAHGLQAVHDQGIIHRDLKPENVFLLEQDGKKDNVKIVDFGIAKATSEAPVVRKRHSQEDISQVTEQKISSQTMPGTLMGTPAYLAPEMALGQEVDFRVDQYALGVILFEMLTGDLPFEATTIGQMLQHHISTKPPLLSRKISDSSPTLDALVARLLSKKPVERFPSMRAVAEALEKEVELRLLARGDTALPAHIAEALSKTQAGTHIRIAGRKVPLWVLLPVLMIFVVAGGAASWLLWRQRVEQVGITPEELAELRQKALDVVREYAKGDDAPLRALSAQALSQTRDPSQRPQLEALLGDAAPQVRVRAALALGAVGDRQATTALRAALSGPIEVKLAAAMALSQLADSDGHKVLVDALAAKEPAVQKQAALYLCELGDEAARQVLSDLHNRSGLGDDEDFLALQCLVRFGDEPARVELAAKVEAGQNRKQKLEAMFRLAELGDEPTRTELRQIASKRGGEQLLTANRLASPEEPQLLAVFRPILANEFGAPTGRQLAAEGVGKSGELPQIKELGPLLDGKVVAVVRQTAAAAILRLASGDPGLLTTASLSWAQNELGSGSASRRLLALQVLGDLPSSQAVALLSTAMQDGSADIRHAAAKALGRRKERTAMTLLLESVADRDEKVRYASLLALLDLVGRLSKRDAAGLLQAAEGVLKEILQKGSVLEQALASSVLLRLGDKKQVDRLKALRSDHDPQIRHLILDALSSDHDFVALFLSDAIDSVRLHAARILAQSGDKRAVPVLKAFFSVGGVDGLHAAGLLRRLGIRENLPPDLLRLLHSASVEERVAAVRALRDVDVTLALSLLRPAAADPAAEVRRAVAEVASSLPKGPGGYAGVPLLRQLSQDNEATVWTLARSLLARLLTPEDAPIVEPTLPPRRSAFAPEPPKPAAMETEPPTGTVTGKLSVVAAEPVVFQVGKRPWQQAPATVELPVGKHMVATLATEQEVNIVASGEPYKLELSESPAEKFLRIGIAAAKGGDSKKALTNLERARAICQKDRKHSHDPPCHSIVFDASYYQGRMHENAKDLHLAMEAYQKALEQGEKVKGRTDLKNQLIEITGRLRGRLGQVIVKSLVNGRCQSKVYWMIPAKHQVRDGQGRSISVDLRAGDQREVGSCDGDK